MEKITSYLFLVLLVAGCVKTEEADLVVHNGYVYENLEQNVYAEAFAVKDGRIIEVGAEHQIMNRYRADEFIDAGKKPIIPGLIDAHSYFMETGLLAEFPHHDFRGASNSELKQKLTSQKGNTLWGFGVNKEDSSLADITKSIFDQNPKKTILLKESKGELVWEVSSIYPEGNWHKEHEEPRTFRLIDSLQTNVLKESFLKAQSLYFQNGFTTVAIPTCDRPIFNTAVELAEEGKLTIDLVFYFGLTDRDWLANLAMGLLPPNIHIGGLSLYADGGYRSGNALLSKSHPYYKRQADYLLSDSLIKIATNWSNHKNYPLLFHVFGDSALTNLLTQMKKYPPQKNDHRWRVFHLQFIQEEQLSDLAELHLIPGVAPYQAMEDKDLFERPYFFSYPLKSLKKSAGIFSLGTLAPLAPLSTMVHFYYAIHHPLLSDQSLTKDEVTKAFTLFNAISLGIEDQKGTLQKGMEADFCIVRSGWEMNKPSLISFDVYKKGKKVSN